MNYLAHAYLSFHQPDILVGNMISDFVKGKKQFDYAAGIQKGIQLHRAIDSFTDKHLVTKEAKLFFKPAVGAYAGAFMDVVYDHFLALDEMELTAEGWKAFSEEVYLQLARYHSVLPEKFGRMLPFMTNQDWLYNYRFKWGIENSFAGVARRATYLAGSTQAFEFFEKYYAELGQYSREFLPDVKNFARSHLDTLLIA